jgi:hypothetical protein
MADSTNVSALRARIAETLWHTEKLRLLGLDESYLESYFLGESLNAQLDHAMAQQGSSTIEGGGHAIPTRIR